MLRINNDGYVVCFGLLDETTEEISIQTISESGMGFIDSIQAQQIIEHLQEQFNL